MAAAPPKTGLAGERTDLCVANGLVSTGLGFASGAVLSLLVFKRASISLLLSYSLTVSILRAKVFVLTITLP